ncbi:neutral/alkaline non-lysosomal ceramidase N-terminal domain-containing protein [Echinicola sp. CAU 1574]|uniref:Neutral/alkaline non-lysosomal ceramidase N-terminal domain-containing protein n=1 Tax=Echinicola arenosa TaxID=2774144 RepID=A0ABR9AI71_9BACT|nr:neutral/alkaline non-lysosomal ceramidase N-terminal domain-containing protein [Echinicola arenosa]MBD8488431.1 neutral/alkaline non-lysosomal ceramidase N-terminal domain-containing protein [Echinicola arenosa]
MLRKILKTLAWITGLLLLLAFFLLDEVDWSEPRDKAYYQETLKAIDQLEPSSSQGDAWLAGWSRVNVTPQSPVDLVGYKPRGKYEFVEDSSFVKALVLGNGHQNIAYLNYELLIVHPFLASSIQKSIKESKLPINQVYFTATHTHSGMGGYIPGLMGKIAFGGYEEEIVQMLATKTVQSIQEALSNQDHVRITYERYAAPQFVANRFIPDDPVDPFIRQLIFTKPNGAKGTLFTYTAHATCLSSKFMGLSGDYPFYLTKDMMDDYDFSLFAAGTVGSHRPLAPGNTPKDIRTYAHQLDSLMEAGPISTDTIQSNLIKLATLKPTLPEATYRVSNNIRLRPWLFNSLFGDTNSHFDLVQIGNTLMISSSGEISGVFYKKWEKLAKEKGLNLMITSFNGGYMGYIVPDVYYNRNYHEVRDMNWYGPYSGSFYDAIITAIISSVK